MFQEQKWELSHILSIIYSVDIINCNNTVIVVVVVENDYCLLLEINYKSVGKLSIWYRSRPGK